MDADVIVVGAGAAGLAAALELARRPLRVIVLEARDRIGGRVRWETLGSVDVPVELGAEFIHGEAPETSALLAAAGLSSVETGGDSWTCAADGELRAERDDFTSNDIFERARVLDHDESVDVFLRRFDADPALGAAARRARAFVEGFEAADPALASARAIAEELHSGVDATARRPIGSYAPLFDALGAACARAGVDLRLRTAVTRIDWVPGRVAIEATHDGRAQTVRARSAVVTVPLGVLQQSGAAAPLSFSPPLPPAKEAALHGLAMGHVVRVTLAFRTPFWESLAGGRYRDAAFLRCEGGPFAAFWTQMPERRRTIVAWAGGPRAAALRASAPAARVERALAAFGALLGSEALARREWEGGVTHDWSADPFAAGAYSYVVAGGGDARSALAAPLEATLMFAGEATAIDGQGGTVSGAFATGTRAAREVP